MTSQQRPPIAVQPVDITHEEVKQCLAKMIRERHAQVIDLDFPVTITMGQSGIGTYVAYFKKKDIK